MEGEPIKNGEMFFTKKYPVFIGTINFRKLCYLGVEREVNKNYGVMTRGYEDIEGGSYFSGQLGQ